MYIIGLPAQLSSPLVLLRLETGVRALSQAAELQAVVPAAHSNQQTISGQRPGLIHTTHRSVQILPAAAAVFIPQPASGTPG